MRSPVAPYQESEPLFADAERWQGHTASTFSWRLRMDTAGGLLSALGTLALIAFAIYALVTGNTQEVLEPCGRSLWLVVVVRLFLGFMLVAVVAFAGASSMSLWGPFAGMAAAALCAAALLLTFFILEIMHATQAIVHNDACRTALIAATPLNSPLLAIIAYVFAAFDGLLLLGIMGTACWGAALFAAE